MVVSVKTGVQGGGGGQKRKSEGNAEGAKDKKTRRSKKVKR